MRVPNYEPPSSEEEIEELFHEQEKWNNADQDHLLYETRIKDKPSDVSNSEIQNILRQCAPRPAYQPAEVAKDLRRDIFLTKKSQKMQVDALKWAEKYGIRPDDPAWLLVDMLGMSKEMTDAIPARIEAASRRTVDAITTQRKAESAAFADAASKMIIKTLNELTVKIAKEADNLTDTRLKQKMLQNSLLVGAALLTICALCFAFGFASAGVVIPWYGVPKSNLLGHIISLIFALPVGYLVIFFILLSFVYMFWCFLKKKL
jgi:hypothetical protein